MFRKIETLFIKSILLFKWSSSTSEAMIDNKSLTQPSKSFLLKDDNTHFDGSKLLSGLPTPILTLKKSSPIYLIISLIPLCPPCPPPNFTFIFPLSKSISSCQTITEDGLIEKNLNSEEIQLPDLLIKVWGFKKKIYYPLFRSFIMYNIMCICFYLTIKTIL